MLIFRLSHSLQVQLSWPSRGGGSEVRLRQASYTLEALASHILTALPAVLPQTRPPPQEISLDIDLD